ncbi:uncharacterized protein MAL13P1.304-like [Contarinia nasturtii]|uniref:uncharacterized protein MAL13P1.304-like n=1 Tax=Contarinia nasturtii TaxID=265458 RepID=UPI0012D4476A|nr:uncharacterized protein MAL13P1.304-like [Contarinia nasturtii]
MEKEKKETEMEIGEFLEEFDWNDARFSPWKLPPLEILNAKQRLTLLEDEDLLENATKLTDEDYKEMCLKLPTHVVLSCGQVCVGVEKSWPKLCFRKNNMDELNSKEKRYIYHAMERKGTTLYNKYVNMERNKERQNESIDDSLLFYYEIKYRRLLYERIRRLETETETEVSLNSESNDENSIVTVINTQTKDTSHREVNNKDNQSVFDVNYNDMSNMNDENVANNLQDHDESQTNGQVRNQGKKQPVNQHDENDIDGNDDEVVLVFSDHDEESEEVRNQGKKQPINQHTKRTSNMAKYDEEDVDSDSDDENLLVFPDTEERDIMIDSDQNICVDKFLESTITHTEEDEQTVQDIQLEDYLSQNTGADFGTQDVEVAPVALVNTLQQQRRNVLDDPHDEEIHSEEIDSLEFITEVTEARTSTQN